MTTADLTTAGPTGSAESSFHGSPWMRSADPAPLILTRPADAAEAAVALAAGAVVAHGFANFYVITTRPDADVVRSVNLMKGRPPNQTGSVTTTPSRLPLLFDWDRLPGGLTRSRVLDLIDALFTLGPFGFRGPASAHLPRHLTEYDGDIRTTQVIAPGYRCPSNGFLADALTAVGQDHLYITSCNRSRHLTGADDEPAHHRASGIRAEFGHRPGFLVLEHHDETVARAQYPAHDPMSTTIVAFHKLADHVSSRPRLVMERHGSLPVERVASVASDLGFDVALGPRAQRRLELRDYERRGGDGR